MANIAPVWITISNTFAFSSAKPSSSPTRIRCPVDEIEKLGQALHSTENESLCERREFHGVSRKDKAAETAALKF